MGKIEIGSPETASLWHEARWGWAKGGVGWGAESGGLEEVKMFKMEKHRVVVCSQYSSFRLLLMSLNQWNKIWLNWWWHNSMM